MVAELWLLLVLAIMTTTSGVGSGLGGNENFLGTGLKLNPPAVTEVSAQNWDNWSWKQRNYLAMEDPHCTKFLVELETQLAPVTDAQVITYGKGETVDPGTVPEPLANRRRHFASRLKYYLSNMVAQTNTVYLKSAQAADDANGFETWRLLARKYRTEEKMTSHSVFQSMMSHRFTATTFETDLDAFEVLKKRYEALTDTPVDNSFLVGMLYAKTEAVLPNVNTHLRLNGATFTTYEQVKTCILNYLRLTQPVTVTADINALKGKGRGKYHSHHSWNSPWKGKGKGKWNSYSKGKGKWSSHSKGLSKGKSYYNSPFKGLSKGKGKGNWKWTPNFRKGKGKGLGLSKGYSKGKGKGTGTDTCFKCGKPGHYAANCDMMDLNYLDYTGEWTTDNRGNWSWTVSSVDDYQTTDSNYDPSWDEGTWTWTDDDGSA